MVLKTQSSFANIASLHFASKNLKQLPQVTDRRSTIISRQNLELPIFFDRCFDKNRIKTFIGWLLANFGENTTVYIVEKLKNLGFYFATEAGISLSIDDLQVPSNKNWFLSQAEKDIKKNHNNFQCGNLTPVEQSQQLLDRWHRTSEILRESVIQSFRLTNTLNPVYMMAFSGARGNISQVRQLVGMRGLMADPQGQIISFPIRSNFREGLTLTEYVISCYGARKGVVDTALRTADSGYLTRRLVDVSQHVVVWTFDCKTDAGIHLTEMKEGKKIILSLKKRILGRVLAQEIPTIAFRNQQISAQLAQEIVSLREHVLVRSPLSCNVPNSVCQLCYGWSLSRGRIVSLGEAVGVIAAQSIGEPGTQLTMRTFHTGGVFSGDVIDEIRAPYDGSVHFLQPLLGQLIRTSHGKIAYLTRASGSFIIKKNFIEKKVLGYSILQNAKQDLIKTDSVNVRNQGIQDVDFPQGEKQGFASQNGNHMIINLEPGTALFVRQGERVIAKQLLAEYSSISAQTKERVEAQHQVYSDQKGEIFFDDVILGKKLKKEEPEAEKGSVLNSQRSFKQNENQIEHFTKQNGTYSVEQNIQQIDPQSGRKIDIITSLKLNTLWILSGTSFEPPVSSPLYAKIGDLVDKTTLLTVIQNELNLQTSHLGGEYILSAQLRKNKITKRKEKLLTFFRKNKISSKSQKISQKENLEGDIKKENSLFLNEFSLNLIITNIKYKKSGYFFTNCKKEKPQNFYSLFFQAGSTNLLDNLINSKENSKILNWDFIFSKSGTNFPSGGFLQTAVSADHTSSAKGGQKTLLFQREVDILRLFAANKITKTEFLLGNLKEEAAFFFDFLKKNSASRDTFDKRGSTIFKPKYSKESAKAKDLWWRSHNLPTEGWIQNQLFLPKFVLTSRPCFAQGGKVVAWQPRFIKKASLSSLNEKTKVIRKNQNFLTKNLIFGHFASQNATYSVPQNIQKFGRNKKNVNHFFTTTSLSQPFSNCREFKNEFVLQWFSPLFKTEAGGLIYTNNDYCNKRSIETHIFFTAEGNYGKKDLGKLNFGKRKRSFDVVSFKELIAPRVSLANVFLNGKKKPSSSFKNSFLSFSEDFASILPIRKSVKETNNTDIGVSLFSKPKNIDLNKKGLEKSFMRADEGVSINSLLSEIDFLQNSNLNKQLFFVRKKENFSLYSVSFHSTKTETLNTTINLLKKGFLSFKNKWVETDIPLGYQKNLQGSQTPFYSAENGLLRNKLGPSFFTNQYSNYWIKKKNKRFSASFLRNFYPLTLRQPLPQIRLKKRDSHTKKTCLIDSFYLNKNKFFSRNEILLNNFDRKNISEKVYQKEFWLANQTIQNADFSRSKKQGIKQSNALSFCKNKVRFSLAFLLPKIHLNLAENRFLKFNPFPSKGTYLSSALIFRINMRAISFGDFQKENSLFYNPYPYSQPLFVEFLQSKSTANFQHLTKSLKTDLGLQDKDILLQSKTIFPKSSSLTFGSTENKPIRGLALQTQKSDHLADIKVNLKTKDKENFLNLHFEEQKIEKQKQVHKNQKFTKFSAFLQKEIKKIYTKRQNKTGEKLQRSNLQIRPGWLYLPKDQFQTAKIHQSFIPPFQQNIDEILFDQFPVYIESILRKNFEDQLADIYLQPSTNIVSFYKTKTLIEKSQLQKFINQVSTISTKPRQYVPGLKISKERSNRFLLSLRETFWRGSTFSSFVEKDFTTFCDNNTKVSKLAEKGSLYQTNLPTNFLNHTRISCMSSFLSFLLRNKKDKEKRKFLSVRPVSINPIKIAFQVVTNKSCRFHSVQSFALSCVNDVNLDFSQDFFSQSQIVDRKLNQNKISIEKRVNPGFFLCLPQISRIYFIKNKPFSDFILISRQLNFDQIKTKYPIFSYKDENQVSKSFLKEKPGSEDTIAGNQGDGIHFAEQNINRTNYLTDHGFVEKTFDKISKSSTSDRFDQIKSKEQNLDERLTLSEENENLICKGKQILTSPSNGFKMIYLKSFKTEASNRHENLPKTLQNKTFLIQNLSTKVDTDYLSFLILIPNSLKNRKSRNIISSIPEQSVMAKPKDLYQVGNIKQNVDQTKDVVFDKTSSFQTKKPSFFDFFPKKSKLWLLIRKVTEHPLLDTSISQQKTRLYKRNQTFFEKELISSSTPLSLYMSNKILFSSKFNKQKRRETYLSFYHSPKASLKVKENLFYLLKTFSGLEKQNFINLSIELTKNGLFNKTKFFENKLKLPLHLYSCQKTFWQLFDLHYKNVQKDKFFEGKPPLVEKTIFDTQAKHLLKDEIVVEKKIWFFQKENLENPFLSQEKEQTIVRSFKQSFLFYFLLNFNISSQSPLQRIEIRTTFEKFEGSPQTSSCAHYLNSQKTHINPKNNFSHTIREDLLPQTFTFIRQSILRDQVFKQSLDTQKETRAIFDKVGPKFYQKKSKLWEYSFTPFARDLSLTLFFTAKLNQSWFFSLANHAKNEKQTPPFVKTKFLGGVPFEEGKLSRSLESSNKTQLNKKKTRQEYLQDKNLISKESSSYPLKEKSSYTTLLLDPTITTYDKSPVAITALMSREEGEIENFKNNSVCLILKNSDTEILFTKKEKPLVVVGQLVRYGEQIANGIATPKSGQIIQVDINKVTLRKAQPILFPRGGSVDVSHGDYVKEGSPLLSLSYQRLVTGDIVQGIPKIEQLFEARETEGGQPLLSSLHSELEAIFLSYSTQLGLKLAVRESFKEIQQIIVDRVQRVYIAQGVLIADKHFEVVIRQMTSKVRILDGGRPGFLYGELVDLRRVELLNAGVPFANEQALYEPIILGISKACLEAEGFLSPASFQETTRVLSLAAIERKTDFLRGIKERVILGDVIQAGTGFTLYDRPVRKIKQEECIDLSLSVLHNSHSTLSTNQYYKQL